MGTSHTKLASCRLQASTSFLLFVGIYSNSIRSVNTFFYTNPSAVVNFRGELWLAKKEIQKNISTF